jgi:anti-sigma factor RsiW
MNCRRVRKRVAAYQDGEIGGEERDRISAHLDGCPSCRRSYAELERVWQELGSIPEIEVSGGFERRLLSRIHAAPAPRSRRRFPSVFEWFTAPAMAFGVVLIGIALGTSLGNLLVGGGSRTAVSQAGYSLAAGEIYSFKAFAAVPPGTLGDGYVRMAHLTEDRPR